MNLIGVEDFDRDPDVKKFVIVGCGRSGTFYMTEVFKILGYKVGHEGLLRNGISSWYIVEKARSDYVKMLLHGHDITFIHIVRNPLHVIRSMQLCELLKNREALDFVRDNYKFFKEYGIKAVARWWILWNMEVSHNFPINITLPIEQLQHPDALYNLCGMCNVKYTSIIYQKVMKLGVETHTLYGREKNSLVKTFGKDILKDFTWSDLVNEDSGIADLVNKIAMRYGYRIEE